MAISALAIVPSSQITLIKVWQTSHQKENSRPVSHWHPTLLNRITLALLSMDTIYDIALAIYWCQTLIRVISKEGTMASAEIAIVCGLKVREAAR